MNDVQCLIDRQLGLTSRIGYDNVLKRLIVNEADSFHRLGAPGELDPPIFACRFAEVSGLEHILALANEDGRVAIQDVSKTCDSTSLEGFECHNNAVFDLAWMPKHMNFVTVSGDHTACLWDVGEGPPKRVVVCSGHTRSVKTAVFRPAQPHVFATGGRDGNILLWDVRCAANGPAATIRPDNSLLGCHSGFLPKTPGSHGKRPRLDAPRAVSVTGLAFRDDLTLISCGECDGNIKLWDLRRSYTAHTRDPLPLRAIPYCGSSTRNGYTNLVVDNQGVRLYASCMDSVIYCFNVAALGAAPAPDRRYVGHESGTFYIKAGLSPDGAYLVSGSSDKHVYLWNVRRAAAGAAPLLRLTGHRAEVTCAAWCRDPQPLLVTCGDDARHHVWRIGPELGLRTRDHTVCGYAEPVPKCEPPPPAAAWGAPRTPVSARRKRPRKHSAGGPPPKTRRCLADLMNAAPSPAPDVTSAGPPSPKRPRTETEPESPPRERAVLKVRSPNTAERVRARINDFASSLPDYVCTGEAPHLRLMSPVKRRGAEPDWLTVLARQKRARRDCAPVPDVPSSPAPPSQQQDENVSSPSRRRAAPAPHPARTLLKYFSVTHKDKVK